MKKIKTVLGIALLWMAVSAFTPFTGYQVGDTVSDFKLKNVDGKMVSMADYKTAKGFIVVFTCNHCPFSKAYEQRIMDLNTMYAPKGYPVIAISSNDKDVVPEDSYENMQALAKEKQYAFPYLYDETQAVAKTFGATRTPQIFILNKEKKGTVLLYTGAIDDNTDNPADVTTKYVQNAMTEILAGKPVEQNFTKAVGCSIKWAQ